ncbi:MAG: hypothetical protein ACREQ9_19665 [Candidatus Binatia bacterium]
MRDTFKALTEAVRGRVITPSHPDYDQARAVHNGMRTKLSISSLRARLRDLYALGGERVADLVALFRLVPRYCARFHDVHGADSR